MEADRLIMELARYGVPPSEVERDPRPSRLMRLLDAGRVMDARVRLGDLDEYVNTNGVQGEVKETYPPGKRPPPSGVKVELVGFQAHQQKLLRQAYPEMFSPEALAAKEDALRRARQEAVFEEHTAQPSVRLRVLRNEDGEVTGFAHVEAEDERPGAEPGAAPHPARG